MVIEHKDSNGNVWYFRVEGTRNNVAVVARKLSRAASRVKLARIGPNHSNVSLSRAMLAEAVALADLQAYNGITVEDYDKATQEDRFTL